MDNVSTHSRPKAAGRRSPNSLSILRSFNTQPPEGGWDKSCRIDTAKLRFQHTAARRRLDQQNITRQDVTSVSTHSRPKAAGFHVNVVNVFKLCFNTQPPEGGWIAPQLTTSPFCGFNTQPPEGGWKSICFVLWLVCKFQHTAARRRLEIASSIRWGFFVFQHTAARRRLAAMLETR